MSLAEAVLAVAEGMEKAVLEKDDDGTDLWPLTTKLLVRSHAAMLRTAVVAVGDAVSSPPAPSLPPGFGPDGKWHSPAWHARQGTVPPDLSRAAEAEEEADCSVEVAGSSPPLTVLVPSGTPLGGKVIAGGARYVLGEDRKLHPDGS